MPPIIRFAVASGAPIAEEAFRIGIGANAEILELRDACALNPIGDVAAEIEHGVAITLTRHEEAGVRPIGGGKTVDEFRSDFVIWLPDGGPQRCDDTVSL